MTSPGFTTTRDDLTESLKRLRPGLANSGSVRADITGDNVRISTEDSEVAAIDTFGIADGSDGSIIIPTARIANILKFAGDGTVKVTVDKKSRLAITTEGGSYALATDAVENFRAPEVPGSDQVTVDAAVFADAVAQVAPAAGAGGGAPVLSGMLLTHYSDGPSEGLRLVATDSNRLAVRDVAGTGNIFGDSGKIVPADALIAATKVLSSDGKLHVRHDAYRVAFADHRTVVVMAVINAEYPAYERVIPGRSEGTLVANRDELALAVHRAVAACTTAATLRVTLKDHAEISAHQSDVADGESDPVGTFTGAATEIGFNHELLLDGIKACHDGELVVSTIDAMSAVTIRNSAVDDFTYVLMPLRIS